MKPLKSETKDAATLQELGRASVQIVHDLKNQLNGLKLYATFLRKRMEKSERPADEQETVTKLIAGLERAAADMNTLVRYSRTVELRRQPQTNLLKILRSLEEDARVTVEANEEELLGDFDAAVLAESFRIMTEFALNKRPAAESTGIVIHLRLDEGGQRALIEWRGLNNSDDGDPFHSFAGSEGLRMSLAAKIIETHGGEVASGPNLLSILLPLSAEAQSAVTALQSATALR